MAARPTWEGFLKFSLISIAVKAYSATKSGGGKIGFHLLHKGCGSRVRYQKVCPVHGEVQKDDIESGYEYAKGQYVIVDPAELDKLRTEQDKAISIDAFVSADEIDPVYFAGRTYYLVPDGRVAQKPYAVLQEVMAQRNRYGMSQVVFSGREQIALVRPVAGLFALTLLNYADQVKKPAEFEDYVSEAKVTAEERKLAETLIDASTTEDFDLSQYADEYATKLQTLIDAKVKGKKIVAGRKEKEPAVINLMDALRQSLKRAQADGDAPAPKPKAPKKPVAKSRKPARTVARRKTG